jgi:hypothetical protein
MKVLAAVFLSLFLVTAQAQTPAQWSQLVAYVGKLANRMLDQQQEIELHKQTINVLIEALDQERCRISRTISSLKAATAQEPTTPVTTVENVACKDLVSPVPPFPTPIP